MGPFLRTPLGRVYPRRALIPMGPAIHSWAANARIWPATLMAFDLPTDAQTASVRVGVVGTDVESDCQMRDNRVMIRLVEPAEIAAGQVIDVEIAY